MLLYCFTKTIVQMAMEKPNKPTDSELEILSVLWDRSNASVREVHEELTKIKDSGYTTTLKLMQIMYEKGLVTRDDSRKVHVYAPLISRENARKQFVGRMINNLFSGSSAALALQALGHAEISKTELEEIQELINQLKAGQD